MKCEYFPSNAFTDIVQKALRNCIQRAVSQLDTSKNSRCSSRFLIQCVDETGGLFDVDERLKLVSDLGDPLEVMAEINDFEGFRPVPDTALARSDRSKGGCPPFDPILMFKILTLQALNDLSDERAEFLITDRLFYMRFLVLGLGDKAANHNTIWTFREAPKKAGVVDELFAAFDAQIIASGCHATHGQIVDASLVSAPNNA